MLDQRLQPLHELKPRLVAHGHGVAPALVQRVFQRRRLEREASAHVLLRAHETATGRRDELEHLSAYVKGVQLFRLDRQRLLPLQGWRGGWGRHAAEFAEIVAEFAEIDLCGGSRSAHQNFRTTVPFCLARTGDLELAEEFVEIGV